MACASIPERPADLKVSYGLRSKSLGPRKWARMDPLNLAPSLPRAEGPPGPGDPGWLVRLCWAPEEHQTRMRRKSLLQARVMDFLTSTAVLPLLFGCVGVFSLLKLLQWLRMKAYIRDAVVVITGATSGLGRECARVFYAAGAKLVLCGRNAKALEELTEELAASQAAKVQTHRPCSVTFDLSDPGCIVGAAAEILRCFGHVDVLINNAGVGYRGTVVDTSTDVDRRVMEINYFGPVALTKALLPSMVRRRQGHVVAISSIQGRISIPFRSAFPGSVTCDHEERGCMEAASRLQRDERAGTSVGMPHPPTHLALWPPTCADAASKHATQAFFDCLRAELEQCDIEVTVISPGYIHTNLSLNAITASGARYGGEALVSLFFCKKLPDDSVGTFTLIWDILPKTRAHVGGGHLYWSDLHHDRSRGYEYPTSLLSVVQLRDRMAGVPPPPDLEELLVGTQHPARWPHRLGPFTDKTTAEGRSPVEVAQDVLAAVGKRKKDVVLAGLAPSLAVYLRALAPSLFFRLMAARARKEQKPKHC
ncbi:Dehydrogenase/reductase SDR family member 7B [Camelus dromedarius]|uniref:Dehydrogenase/reductase SDR family member 7B n=1 Tax=Camelus dromedarius TaxID=9838 RepID=A0A5N4D0W7_CAMDR|nr:Dehydrogenase/reductase SDR family member 7B [Camelus dromedarius]